MKKLTRKIYRANYNRYAVQVCVKGNVRSVTFLESTPRSGQKSSYITDNPDIQAALEESPAFNKDFHLEKQFNFEVEEVSTPKPVVETIVEKSNEPAKDKTILGPEDEVTNTATAKAYLLDKFADEKQDIIALKRADEVRDYAKQKGVVFKNWE